MLAIDANFYHKIDPLKSTLRLTAEYKKQDVDQFDYPVPEDTTGLTYTFNNSSNAYYASASIRPSGSDNEILRNFELAFRFSQFKTPTGAPWGTDDVTRTVVALDYWLKWNCLLKLAYEKQTNLTSQVFLQMYYGF